MREIVYNGQNEKRLDSFLQETFPSLNFSKLNQFLRENKIKVNKKKVSLSTRLNRGDIITLFILDDLLDKSVNYSVDIVYEDDNVLILNKPAGLIVEDENNASGDSLIVRAKKYIESKGEDSSNLVLCHRLDLGTCGLVILAKDMDTENLMIELIRLHKITKEYRCITYGIPSPREGTINNYLLKDPTTGTVKQYKNPRQGAKEAITDYYVVTSSDKFALVNVTLKTGRTHQIRVHMAGIGCPIVGDSKYGNNSINKQTKQKRQLLCAYKLKFPAIDGKYLALSNKTIEIPLPNNIATFLAL